MVNAALGLIFIGVREFSSQLPFFTILFHFLLLGDGECVACSLVRSHLRRIHV